MEGYIARRKVRIVRLSERNNDKKVQIYVSLTPKLEEKGRNGLPTQFPFSNTVDGTIGDESQPDFTKQLYTEE